MRSVGYHNHSSGRQYFDSVAVSLLQQGGPLSLLAAEAEACITAAESGTGTYRPSPDYTRRNNGWQALNRAQRLPAIRYPGRELDVGDMLAALAEIQSGYWNTGESLPSYGWGLARGGSPLVDRATPGWLADRGRRARGEVFQGQ